MIAPAPRPQKRSAPERPRSVREATRRRTTRARRRSSAPLLGVLMLVGLILIPLLLYVWLNASLMSTSLALSKAEHERAALTEETQRLDDKVARLTSPERLAAVAAKLGMRDPHVYAVVALPEPPKAHPKPGGLALLGEWFSGASRTVTK